MKVIPGVRFKLEVRKTSFDEVQPGVKVCEVLLQLIEELTESKPNFRKYVQILVFLKILNEPFYVSLSLEQTQSSHYGRRRSRNDGWKCVTDGGLIRL